MILDLIETSSANNDRPIYPSVVQFYGSVETVSNDLKDTVRRIYVGHFKDPKWRRTSTERTDFGPPSTWLRSRLSVQV